MESSVGAKKTIALFNYIKELATLKYKVTINIDHQIWWQYIKDIPESDDIYCYSSGSDELMCDDGLILLKVHKPADSEFTECPEPPKELLPWLVPGWDKYQGKCGHIDSIDRESPTNAEEIITISFNDDETRIEQFNSWKEKRDAWAETQKRIASIRSLFVRLYELSKDLDRESETQELMIGNGIIQDIEDKEINHPILLKRVRFVFDAEDNTIMIVDADTEPELYTMLLQKIETLDYSVIAGEMEVLEESSYHPFDASETPAFLRTLIHRLSPEGEYYVSPEEKNSAKSEPITVTWDPVFFVRRRIDGTIKAIEQILQNIDSFGNVPKHILDIVGEGKSETPEEAVEPVIEELLAQSCGESKSILLSKEANREQLEIAERIDKYNAVLVQGPPGTGKTHTIANLLGNFLAEGKSVLITSHTKKALSVLKEQVPKEIQSLCVSILDDTRVDMERSIEGILEHISDTDSNNLFKQAGKLQRKREKIMESLAETRRKIYTIKHKELDTIVYDGKSYSPLEMAKFVNENAENLREVIPGTVKPGHPFPLTKDEMVSLYQLNCEITEKEELLIRGGLPDLEKIITPDLVRDHHKSKEKCLKCATSLGNLLNMRTDVNWKDGAIIGSSNEQSVVLFEKSNRTSFTENFHITATDNYNEWQIRAIVDGRRGGGYRARWITLKDEIDGLKDFSDKTISSFLGKSITFSAESDVVNEVSLRKLKARFDDKGKITRFDMLAHKDIVAAYEATMINGKPISSSEECKLCLDYYELIQRRAKVRLLWDDLITGPGAIAFGDLGSEPEINGHIILSSINELLDWYPRVYNVAEKYLADAGYNTDVLLGKNNISDEETKARTDINIYNEIVPLAIETLQMFEQAWIGLCAVTQTVQYIENLSNSSEAIFKDIVENLLDDDWETYEKSYKTVETYIKKHEVYTRRNALLSKLNEVAPEWANAVSYKQGVHAGADYPQNIKEAWKWKQFDSIILSLSDEQYDSLQKKAVSFSYDLRKITASLAAVKAWYYLLRRIEANPDMKQALNGWKLTVKKIGKGTGKKAPMLKKQAREQMATCQKAVPVWIMPMSKALESFDASNNQFDVVIIDEASQSDVTALAILYLAKKVIIVGDDKQVSPLAIGMDDAAIINLMDTYLKGVIPNWHLYDPKTSLYDIAMTTYHPLMLREHFRCVPDIIGYSNKLSYDFKIKPLRDASSNPLLPAVVPFRVRDGHRDGQSKVNPKEAITIVALLKACMEMPEYNNQTFGVISLLGDEQAKLVEREINKYIEPSDIEKRRVLCGNASHFQGDERDVIFLSMVDSNTDDGPLRMVGEGAGQSTKQRYNVATSRARNQLWIIHSLDYKNDLKVGDIRKDLLEYSENPKVYEDKILEIKSNADSPFEVAVAAKLVTEGFHIIQQWPVGSYRIDMVAQYGNTRIAIECDGEQFHSGEEKIRQDMERQTILERLGWRFIRIRGSEFYRNPEQAIERVKKELAEYGVIPEERTIENQHNQDEALLEKVKLRAYNILENWNRDMLRDQLDEEGSVPTEVGIDNIPSGQDINDTSVNSGSEDNPKQVKPVGRKGDPETDPKGAKRSVDVNIKTEPEKTPIDQPPSSTDYPKIELIDYLSEYEKSTKPRTFIEKIEDQGFECIDNREQSGIIWAIIPDACTVDAKTRLEELIQKEGMRFEPEARGAVATNGKPAYRIITGKD